MKSTNFRHTLNINSNIRGIITLWLRGQPSVINKQLILDFHPRFFESVWHDLWNDYGSCESIHLWLRYKYQPNQHNNLKMLAVNFWLLPIFSSLRSNYLVHKHLLFQEQFFEQCKIRFFSRSLCLKYLFYSLGRTFLISLVFLLVDCFFLGGFAIKQLFKPQHWGESMTLQIRQFTQFLGQPMI